MSSILYIASDMPLSARPNPHDRMVSVNEALAMGMTNLPSHLMAEDFDRDRPEVLLVSDREVSINVDTGVIEDGNFDDDFAIRPCPKEPGMRTSKQYCAELEWVRYTPGRADQVIGYLKGHLLHTHEIELWHIWLDDQPGHRLSVSRQSIHRLKAEDIQRLEQTDVFSIPPTDYCCLITGNSF